MPEPLDYEPRPESRSRNWRTAFNRNPAANSLVIWLIGIGAIFLIADLVSTPRRQTPRPPATPTKSSTTQPGR
jgi:hypothetical protein